MRRFHSSPGLLGYDAVWCCGWILVFRSLELETAQTSETLVSYHNNTQCHNTEDLDLVFTKLSSTSPWRWRQYGQYPTTSQHGVTTHKTSTWIFTAMKTWKLTGTCLVTDVC